MNSNQPQAALAISAISAGASLTSWATSNAIWFTIGGGAVAILSGLAAFVYYAVSTYYKIKKHEL